MFSINFYLLFVEPWVALLSGLERNQNNRNKSKVTSKFGLRV